MTDFSAATLPTTSSVHQLTTSRPPLVVCGVEQEWAARSLETVLGPAGIAMVRGCSGYQTLSLAASVSPDAVVVDSRLPDIDGLDVCRTLRREGRIGEHVPLILLTSGAAPRDVLRQAYQAGVWGVWEQPVDGELLVLQLRAWIAVKQLVDLAERGRTVELDTNLYTFRGLLHRAHEMVADAVRYKTPVACIALSPVAIAPGTGHERPLPAHALTAFSQSLTQLSRGSDCVGRVGEREFAILAPMTERDGAVGVVHRVRERAAGLDALAVDAQSFRVVIRAGLATITGADPGHAAGGDLLSRATTALRYANTTRLDAMPSFDEVPAAFA